MKKFLDDVAVLPLFLVNTLFPGITKTRSCSFDAFTKFVPLHLTVAAAILSAQSFIGSNNVLSSDDP